VDNKPKWKDLVGIAVSLLTLLLAAYAAFGPLAQLQRNSELQNYRNNIEVRFNYPELKMVNSWNDEDIRSFLKTPLFVNEKEQPVYQAQFSVLNAPNEYLVYAFIFKRIVSDPNPNIFPQPSSPIELRLPDNKIPFANNGNRPRIFKLDMIIVDKNPTTIIINVLDKSKNIIKSEFYHIEN
jgi:hypothetical protein